MRNIEPGQTIIRIDVKIVLYTPRSSPILDVIVTAADVQRLTPCKRQLGLEAAREPANCLNFKRVVIPVTDILGVAKSSFHERHGAQGVNYRGRRASR